MLYTLRPVWILLLLFVAGPIGLSAQTQLVNTPNASPKAAVYQQIGLTDFKIVYHRPAVKGRDIWGALVPDGVVWRAGANDNTVFKVSDDVRIEGLDLPAGVYGLHILPKGEVAEVIFSRNHTSWGSYSYDPKEDALRVEIKPVEAEHPVEHLAYYFTDISKDEATCVLHWEKKKFPFKVSVVNLEEEVMAELRQDLQSKAGWTWRGWYEAANWCLQNEIHEKEALKWASQSVKMFPNPQNMVAKAKLTGMVKSASKDMSVEEVALKTLAADLEENPVTWREWNAAAHFAMNHKDLDHAETWATKAAGLNANMTTLMTKSKVMKAKGEDKLAEKVKKEAIHAGSNAELNAYGYQLLFAGETAEAVSIFETNAKKHPEDPNVWDSLGEGYYHHGQKDKAVESLRKSLSMNPPANVRANSMKLLGMMGEKAEDIKP